MENQNYNFSISPEDLREAGIVNIPQFFQSSKQVITYSIASLAVLNKDNLQGDEDWLTQINHLRQLQTFIKLYL